MSGSTNPWRSVPSLVFNTIADHLTFADFEHLHTAMTRNETTARHWHHNLRKYAHQAAAPFRIFLERRHFLWAVHEVRPTVYTYACPSLPLCLSLSLSHTHTYTYSLTAPTYYRAFACTYHSCAPVWALQTAARHQPQETTLSCGTRLCISQQHQYRHQYRPTFQALGVAPDEWIE